MLAPAVMATAATRLILLGTHGGPRLNPARSNPASLLLANGMPYVIDCGHGVSRQLMAAGLSLAQVRTVLITHHHSDHNLELGPLIYNAWIAGQREPIDIWGPPPLRQLLDDFFRSMAYDIRIRIADEGRVDPRDLVRVHEFETSGVLFEAAGLRVSTARVRHPPLMHAYAYRFDAHDRSIVLSGDTTVSPELVTLAERADVLVHEAMYLAGLERLLANASHAATLRRHLLASHTATDDVGKVAAAAQVKKLVLYHLVPGSDPSITDEMWRAGPCQEFAGEVIVGKDLQVI